MSMTEEQLRTKLGLFWIISHFSIILFIIVLYFLGGFFFDEVFITIFLITPMFSGSASQVVRYIINKRLSPNTESKPMKREWAILAFRIPIQFILFLVIVIMLKTCNVLLTSFMKFLVVLLVGGTYFGTYINLIFSSLFIIRDDEKCIDNNSKFEQ